ncbi:MAG TPA: hypothetical protein VF824_07580 [Thermoanaerobaculia bacterium]|jgi:hypothetical protein
MFRFALVIALVCTACQVEKNDTPATASVKQETTTAAKSAAEGAQELGAEMQKAAHDAVTSDAGQKVVAGAKQVAAGAKQAAGEAAEATGEALAREGREAQADVQKKTPPPATTTTH